MFGVYCFVLAFHLTLKYALFKGFQPSIASGSSQKSTNRWAETPFSSSSYMMPAGVRQLQNIAPLSRDSLCASSVASVSVTGSQNRCLPVYNTLENKVCEVPTQQLSSYGRMLPRVLPSAQSGKFSFVFTVFK
jgi:hypothetical protein